MMPDKAATPRMSRRAARLLLGLGATLAAVALAALAAMAWSELGLTARYPACALARRYVALGSSSTAGVGASDPARTGYVALVGAALRERCPALELTNLGVGGAGVARIAALAPEWERARPQVVTILPLIDYWETDAAAFFAGYAALLDTLGAQGATVFFGDLRLDPALVCGRGGGPGGCYIAADAEKIRAKNRALAALARGRPWVIVVPVSDERVAHPEWQLGDGLHVNDAGHAGFAAPFRAAVARWLDAAAT